MVTLLNSGSIVLTQGFQQGFSITGCTDSTACNYDSTANVDDGSCDLPNGCGDTLYLEYDASVTCSDPTACLTLIVNGCTDPSATNYNPLATVDDGSCILSIICAEDAPTGLFVSDIIHNRVVINWDNMNSRLGGVYNWC